MSQSKSRTLTAEPVAPVLDVSQKPKQESVKTVFDHTLGQLIKVEVQPDTKAKDTADWRLCPIPIIQMITTVWVGWKNKGSYGSASMQLDGKDYEMAMVLRADGPHVECSERVSSNLRSSHQLRLSKLAGEIDDLKATRQPIIDQINGLKSAYNDLENKRKANTDPKWIKEQEQALENWEVTVAEQSVKIDTINKDLEVKEKELASIVDIDMRKVTNWSFAVAELE